MSGAEEFVLVPKHVYTRSQPITEQVLNNPQIQRKAQYLNTIQDYVSANPSEDQLQQQPSRSSSSSSFEKPTKQRETTLAESILGELTALSASQQVKSKHILKKIFDHRQVSIDMSGGLTVDGKAIGLSVATFLWDLQQSTKKLKNSIHETVLKMLLLPEHLVANKDAKDVLKDGWISWPRKRENNFTKSLYNWPQCIW
jgi:hypothetical protein